MIKTKLELIMLKYLSEIHRKDVQLQIYIAYKITCVLFLYITQSCIYMCVILIIEEYIHCIFAFKARNSLTKAF